MSVMAVYAVRYQREQSWCREGIAEAEFRDGKTLLFDTYWQFGDRHLLTPAEAATAEVLFQFDQFDEITESGAEARWLRYAPADRRLITSQHGLCRRYFLRKGAVEDLPTQVENAREALVDAEEGVRTAEWKRDWAQRDLDALLAQLAARDEVSS